MSSFRAIPRRIVAWLGLLFSLAFTLPNPAFAQTPSPRPLFLPWDFAPEIEGVEGIVGHAAGLGFLSGYELGLGWNSRLLGDAPASHAHVLGAYRLGPVAFGLGLGAMADGPGEDHLSTRVDLALGLRLHPTLALGLQGHVLGSAFDPSLDGASRVNLSLSWRPADRWSLSLALQDLGASFRNDLEPTRLEAAFAYRPWRDGMSLGFGLARSLRFEMGRWDLQARLRLMPFSGMVLGLYGGLSAEDTRLEPMWQGGLSLSLHQGSWGFDLGSSAGFVPEAQGETSLHMGGLLRFASRPKASLVSPAPQVLRLRLRGDLAERPGRGLFGAAHPGFAHFLQYLDTLATHPQLAGLVLQIDAAPNWAQSWEIRQALARFQQQGKKVIALLNVADMRATYLASQADAIQLYAAGGMTLQGLSLTRLYFHELLSRIGVLPQMIRFEDYKSAPEAWTRSGPSEASIRQDRAIVSGLMRHWQRALEEGRGLSLLRQDEILSRGPQSMHQALEAGLVDGLLEVDGLPELVRGYFGPSFQLVDQLQTRPEGWEGWGQRPQIAILPVVGGIVDGQSSGGLPIPMIGGATTGDASFITALERALADPQTRGIVVRVASGGGSALASDRMHRALKRAQKRKPILVSFGQVAASGGYYLAASTPIYATPLTVTGSIGLFAGKVDLSGLYTHLGVQSYSHRTHDSADMLGTHRPFTDAELLRLHTTLEAHYQRFIDIVAEGRGLSADTVRRHAQGKVFLAEEAQGMGLIDLQGGLWDAILQVKKIAGIAPEQPISLVYHDGQSPLGPIQKALGVAFGGDAFELDADGPTGVLAWLGSFLEPMLRSPEGGVYAMMPHAYDLP